MGIFGWSMPAGCSGTPYDADPGCALCVRSSADCICPECPVCGEFGAAACYRQHGLICTAEQVASQEAAKVRQGEDAEADNRLAEQLQEEAAVAAAYFAGLGD